MGALATWATAAMLALVPHGTRRDLPGWTETPEEMKARYGAIGEAIEEAALASKSAYSDRAEAALLVALAMEESAFAPDVDKGPCYRGVRGGAWWSRCDGGTSYSVWQLKPFTRADGTRVTGEELQASRALAAKRALSLATGALGGCKKLPERERLSAYLRGTCREGLAGAHKRYDLWKRVEAWNPKP